MENLTRLISELRSTLTRVEKILGTIDEAIVWTDPDGRIFWCNSAFDRLVKQPRILNLGSLIQDSLPLLNSDLTSVCNPHPAFLALSKDSPGTGVYGFRQGETITVIEISWAAFQPEAVYGEQDLSAVLVIRDITERYQAQTALKEANLRLEERVKQRTQELETMIFQDALTQLPSRASLLKKITEFVNSKNFEFTLLYLDCDQFKLVNGSLGFEVGNQLLAAIAQRLQAHLGPEDLLARIGEDEFCFFMASWLEKNTLSRLLDKIRQSFTLPFEVANCEIFMTVSIGVAQGDKIYTSPEEFLQNADISMYRAKKKERGSYQIFDHKMRQEIIDPTFRRFMEDNSISGKENRVKLKLADESQ
ncbi:MAG: diguanylate cyclase [Cyanobacteria bacterium RI_101]|nr:diguanylate cyclase [Cyanobacteria bacterium RI_101]